MIDLANSIGKPDWPNLADELKAGPSVSALADPVRCCKVLEGLHAYHHATRMLFCGGSGIKRLADAIAANRYGPQHRYMADESTPMMRVDGDPYPFNREYAAGALNFSSCPTFEIVFIEVMRFDEVGAFFPLFKPQEALCCKLTYLGRIASGQNIVLVASDTATVECLYQLSPFQSSGWYRGDWYLHKDQVVPFGNNPQKRDTILSNFLPHEVREIKKREFYAKKAPRRRW